MLVTATVRVAVMSVASSLVALLSFQLGELTLFRLFLSGGREVSWLVVAGERGRRAHLLSFYKFLERRLARRLVFKSSKFSGFLNTGKNLRKGREGRHLRRGDEERGKADFFVGSFEVDGRI